MRGRRAVETLGPLVVNRDRLVHLGRWARVLARGVPDHVYASYDPYSRRLVLRVPGLYDRANPGEVRLQVHRRGARTCVYLPASLPGDGGPKAHGFDAGRVCLATYTPTRLFLRRAR